MKLFGHPSDISLLLSVPLPWGERWSDQFTSAEPLFRNPTPLPSCPQPCAVSWSGWSMQLPVER